MAPDEPDSIQLQLAEEFNRRQHRSDGLSVVQSFEAGLTVLRNALYLRLHADVERVVGRDSLVMPVSEMKSELAGKTQIEHYQVAECVAAARAWGYVAAEEDWFCPWLVRLRLSALLGPATDPERAAAYLAQAEEERRLTFTNVLATTLRESRDAPLVLFRLYPHAVQIATALALGDHPRARNLRHLQATVLSAISDCPACRGEVLENGQQCDRCGNPLWKYEWLETAD